jgi:hypothetical protein
MSVLIKGMEIPPTGVYILSVDNTGIDKTIFTIAKHICGKIILQHVGEAVAAPPHGRLIDADALIKDELLCKEGIDVGGLVYVPLRNVMRSIKTATTIIPADSEKEENL